MTVVPLEGHGGKNPHKDEPTMGPNRPKTTQNGPAQLVFFIVIDDTQLIFIVIFYKKLVVYSNYYKTLVVYSNLLYKTSFYSNLL